MPLIGIIAKKREFKSIKKQLSDIKSEIIEITEEGIKNIRNIVFEEIIILQDIDLKISEYKYMNEIISKSKYVILNGDIEVKILKEIEKPMKIITFGFNTKATISISSVNEEKIIVCIQRDIEKADGKIIEMQEKEIITNKDNNNIYNKLATFIIKELHN